MASEHGKELVAEVKGSLGEEMLAEANLIGRAVFRRYFLSRLSTYVLASSRP